MEQQKGQVVQDKLVLELLSKDIMIVWETFGKQISKEVDAKFTKIMELIEA